MSSMMSISSDQTRAVVLFALFAVGGSTAICAPPLSAPVLARRYPRANEMACGPRCLDYILRFYGKTAEFTELVEELQRGDVCRATTLLALRECLLDRGIAVEAVRCEPGDLRLFDWPEPAIMHLKGERGATGHFVVVVPSAHARGYLQVWDGIYGTGEMPAKKIEQTSTGYLLLTSASPIKNARQCMGRVQPYWTLAWAAAISATVVIVLRLRT